MSNMQDLLDGYHRFCESYFTEDNPLQKKLSRAQHPKILVIACSDSRVDPAIILQASPGDLFIVRNVANIVPPMYKPQSSQHGVSAAIEFAVKQLSIRHILVLGHSHCGGIRALLNEEKDDDDVFITPWISIIKKAKTVAKHQHDTEKDRANCCEQEGIKISLNNLMSFPFVKESVEAKKLQLHGWHYHIDTGELCCFNAKKNCFETKVAPSLTKKPGQ
jgi:carbonic anhydrase